MPAPLDGIKVIDLTRYQNGPHATAMLSDMGADVLKVEMPGNGDPGRQLGLGADGFCSYFEALNRGKRSMTLNLRAPEAKDILHKLVSGADVFAENFRPGYLDSLGFGYEPIREVNPQIIYATNSGFGPRGKWSSHGSFDVVAQGMSGAMVALAGGPDNVPLTAPWGLADQTGSLLFAYGIMTALVARERQGVGQKIDVSQLGAMLTLQALWVQGYLHSKQQLTTQPGRAFSPTFAWYAGSDGRYFTLAILDPKHWPPLCRSIGRADLVDDERSADPFARVENREWLTQELATHFKSQPRDAWLDALIEAGIPSGPVYDYGEIVGRRAFLAERLPAGDFAPRVRGPCRRRDPGEL